MQALSAHILEELYVIVLSRTSPVNIYNPDDNHDLIKLTQLGGLSIASRAIKEGQQVNSRHNSFPPASADDTGRVKIG